MSIVKENIEFKRGQDSKKSLKVGEYRKINAPINWDSVSPGYYMAYNDELSVGAEYCIIEVKKMIGNAVINQLTYWKTDINSLMKKERLTNRMFQDAKGWEQSLELTSIEKIDIPKKLSESLNFKRTGDSKTGLNLGAGRYRDNIPLLVNDLKEAIWKIEGGNGFFKANVRHIDKNPWEIQHRGNYIPYVHLLVNSRNLAPSLVDNRIFKAIVRNWIKKHTDFKIHQFIIDKSEFIIDKSGCLNKFKLTLK